MPLCREYNIGRVTVAVWRITESSEQLSSLVVPEYAGEAASISNERRRKEWLAVRALLPRLCGQGARIVYDADGKPTLAGVEGFIGISHTKGYAVLGYSAETPFGVDVELLGRDASYAAPRFMKESEIAMLSPDDAGKAMLVRWCVCEAMFKLVGNVGGTYKDNIRLRSPLPANDGTLEVVLSGCSGLPDSKFLAHIVESGELLVVVCG